MRKWPDTPHWEYDALWLGADATGQWLGVPRGTWMSRPGAGFHATADHVVLVPHDAWWVAVFYGDDPDRPVDTYVDIATPATWAGDRVSCVDLDLDVVRGASGRVWIDDEDEFAERRVTLAYPAHLVEAALASCVDVQSRVEADEPPFRRIAAAGWIARLRQGREGPQRGSTNREARAKRSW